MLDTARPGMPVVTLFAAEGGRAMLVELSVMEQRYHAVMEVVSGAPVTEVARRQDRRGHHRDRHLEHALVEVPRVRPLWPDAQVNHALCSSTLFVGSYDGQPEVSFLRRYAIDCSCIDIQS